MALLHVDNVVLYHPWNSFTEFTRGLDFSNVWGTVSTLSGSPLPADPFVSGLYHPGGAASRTYNNASGEYPRPSSAFSTLTTAFWASGEAQYVDIRFGYGWSTSDPRNTIGVKLTTSGVQAVGEASNTGIVSWLTIDVPRPNPSFYVVRAVPISGTHLAAYLSVNGSAWQWAGAASVSGWNPPSVTGNYKYLGFYTSSIGGWEAAIDEAVLWLDAPEFTSQELNNLYQLANTRQKTMDQYSQEFGVVTASDSSPLFTQGHVVSSGVSDLVMRGYEKASGILPSLTNGHLLGSGTCELAVTGVDNSIAVSGLCDLCVTGIPGESGTLPVFTHGHALSGGTSDLSLTGHDLATGSTPCIVQGASGPCSGLVPLLIAGYTQKPSSCPILDPLASIQIGDDLIQIYQARIDALINQLGKNVLLEYDPIVTPCPNCYLDTEGRRSTGVYKPGGPTLFPRGQKCPHCKGTGTVEEQVTKCIKCLLKWNPSDYMSYGVSVVDPKGIVRTKGYLTDAAAIERASTAIVNYGIQATMRLRVRRLRGPIPVGLRADRYCITFWELIDG